MPDYDDAVLEQQLRRSLRLHLDPLKVGLDGDAIEARSRRQQRDRSGRRRWLVLGLAAAIAIPAVWLAAGSPLPMQETTGTFNVLVVKSIPSDADRADYEFVLVRPDGQERAIARVASDQVDGFVITPAIRLSQDGRVAMQMVEPDGRRTGWAFIDLRAPDRPPMSVIVGSDERQAIGWGPDGRFATVMGTAIAIADPATGDQVSFPTLGRTRVEQRWLDDGRGFLFTDDAIAAAGGEIGPDSTVVDLDGQLVDAAGRRGFLDPLRAPVFRDGLRVVACGYAPNEDACASLERGGSALVGPDGSVTPVFAPVRRDRFLREIAFMPDGAVLGVFDDLSVDRRLVVERSGRSGDRERLAEVPVRAGTGDIWVDGIAPDASLAVATRTESGGDHGPIVLPGDGRPGTYHDGVFVGFLPVDIARDVPGSAFTVVPDSAAPAVGSRPSLPSDDELGRSIDGTSILVASGGADTEETTTKLGKRAFESGAGVVMACLGGGQLEVTIDVEVHVIDCAIGSIGGGSSDRTGMMSVSVQAPAGVKWRVILYDAPQPAPPG